MSTTGKAARVPEVGSVTLVEPVVVSVSALAPEVVKAAAVVRFPAKFTVRAASFSVSVRVLPAVRFSVLARVKSKAPEPVDRIPRPVRAVCVPPLMVGEVRVLLVKVSVVARPTRVSVSVGRVRVPVFEMEEMIGVVRVLLVKV